LDDPLLQRLRRALAPEFEVEDRIAAGGMGIVFLGREVALDRRVAIKVLRPELATATARERFLREARLLARLQHSNIVPVHRADERDGLPFYVMDFVEGRTLAERIATGPLAGPELLRLVNDLCRALVASHEAGIVHRDVKPENIFLVDRRALLGDFGISREAGAEDQELTEDGFAVGTRQYMSPEQLKGRPATDRSDQYAAAAVLYEAATGRPWDTLADPARANWRGVPAPMVRALRRGLAPDPADRWPSVRDMRHAIARAWRRPVRRAVLIALAIIGAAVIGPFLRPLGPPPKDHRALAVLPFPVVGAPADSVGWRVAEVMLIDLAWFPSLTKVSLERSETWRRAHPSEDPEAARRELDVDRVISGNLARQGSRLVLHLVATDSTGSHNLRTLETSGPGTDPGPLGEAAAVQVGTTFGRLPGTDFKNLASRSAAAVGLFTQAEGYFDEDAWKKAASRYAEAVEADSTFVLARWRQLVAQIWSRDFSWDSATALAHCCADRLPPLEAGLVRAMSDTNLPRRFAAFDALHARFADEGFLPLLFASDLFHRGPLVGRGLPESLQMFESAVDMSPGGTPAPAYDQIIWGKIRLGDRNGASRWLRDRGALKTDAEGREIEEFLQLGYDLRWVGWRASGKLWLLEHFESDATIRQLGNFFRFSAAFDLPEGQDAVGAVFATRRLSADRASGFEAQGLARLTWGRVREGLAHIDSAAAYFGTDEAQLQRHQWRLMLPLLGAGRAGEAEEGAARRWLEGQAARGPLAARARWTLALDAVRRHDSTSAIGLIAGLAALGATDTAAARLARLAAAVLQGQSDPRGALAASTDLLDYDSPRPGNDIFTRSVLHLSRARWSEAAGDSEGARREILWYENSDTYRFPTEEAQKMEVDAVASVAARVTRARLLLRAGERGEACPMLARVHQLWQNADASVAPQAAEADSLRRTECQ